jgi:two-component system, OmpR family, alkaline phosphatase synthesis response regulator PhoP
MNESILLIEDEEDLRQTLTDRLESEGYRVRSSGNGEEGFQQAVNGAFDLIVLDVMLPGKNGFDVCRDIRKAGRVMPILMLTARGQLVDKVLGLKIGADDYLVKPFEMLELTARIEALLRRPPELAKQEDSVQQFGTVKIDLRGTTVSRGGEVVPLSAREFQLLRYLLEHRGATLSRKIILKDVWGYNAGTYTRTVDVHIFSLRQKLENDPKNPELILTVLGLGYKFAG